MHINPVSFPSDLIDKIVRCVEGAVGDDILADIQQNDLRTTNSLSFRIWDFLNTNLSKTLNTSECTIAGAHRGPWQMLVIFEKSSQCILTFMREKRFAELRKQQCRRKKMHYIDMLTSQFNSDLLADQQQTTLFPHEFSDKDQLAKLVQDLLQDLGGEADIVRHHVLVLFDTFGFQLMNIRAVMVTPSLDIAQGTEQNWSDYISADESVIVTKVSNPQDPENQPGRGLTLKAKALERKKNRPQKKPAEESATAEG